MRHLIQHHPRPAPTTRERGARTFSHNARGPDPIQDRGLTHTAPASPAGTTNIKLPATPKDGDPHMTPTPNNHCGANKRQTEGTCTRPAGWGTDHPGYGTCKLHGGKTPNSTLNANRQRADAEARAALAQLNLPPVDDPLEALLKLASQVIHWQEATATLVNRLETVRYNGANGTEQLRAEVALYERAMDRAATVLAAIARLDIEDRLARVEERQADAIIAAIDAALAEAGLTGNDAARAKQSVARHLRAV